MVRARRSFATARHEPRGLAAASGVCLTRAVRAAPFGILVIASLLGAMPAAAAHESGGTQLPQDPAAVTDEGARAKAIAAEVRAASLHLPADVAASLARTQQALGRANGAHAAGDARTARLLGKVALGWAEAAKAQLAATRGEKASGDVEKAAADLTARRDRGRALITEAQARKGQLASQIEAKKHAVELAKAPKPDKAPKLDKAAPKKSAGEKAPAKPSVDKPAAKPSGDKPPSKPAEKKAPKKGAQP